MDDSITQYWYRTRHGNHIENKSALDTNTRVEHPRFQRVESNSSHVSLRRSIWNVDDNPIGVNVTTPEELCDHYPQEDVAEIPKMADNVAAVLDFLAKDDDGFFFMYEQVCVHTFVCHYTDALHCYFLHISHTCGSDRTKGDIDWAAHAVSLTLSCCQ